LSKPVLGKIHYYGMWQIPTHATKVLCSDGRRRYAKVTAPADTWFSLPARVKVKGKSVSGYLTGRQDEEGREDVEFVSYFYDKNHELLP
jgi:hypothetical protein